MSGKKLIFDQQKFYVSPDIQNELLVKQIIEINGGQLDHKDAQDVILVINLFSKDNELLDPRIGKKIVSPKCIFESIEINKPLPELKHPLYARFMEGITLCIEKTPETEETCFLSQSMGATVVETITDQTEYLITTRVGSVLYQLARMKVPIVGPKWIRECWRMEKLVECNQFLLPPFIGCIISVTGLSASTRNEVQRLIKAYGGEYTPNLTKRCTHLISQQPQGIKYRYALEWGIHCVNVHWIFDSINHQVCVDETLYFLPMSEATRQALFNPLFTSTRDFNRLSPALREKHLMQLQKRTGNSFVRLSDMLLMKGNHEKHEEQNKDDSDDLGGNYPPPLPSKPLATVSSAFMGMPFNLSSSFNPKQSEDPTEPEDTEMEVPATFKAPESISNQIQNLLDLCNSTIEYYQVLSKKVDLSTLTTSSILPSLSTTSFGYESTDYPSKNWPNKSNYSQLHLHPIWKSSNPPQTTSTTSNDNTQSPDQPTVPPTPNLIDHSIIMDSHTHSHSHNNDPNTGDVENHPAPDPANSGSGDDH